jgi:protein ImuA
MTSLFPSSPAAEARAALLSAPHTLHPGLWRAQGRGAVARAEVLPSGFASLDAELPGGGWPLRVLTELLLARPGVGELRLLAPALAAVARQGRCLMFFDPPAGLCADGLAQLGLAVGQCLVVRGRDGVRHSALRQRLGSADLGWALEQALRSGQVGAVLAWPGAHWQPEALRRLQVAAQAHPGPAFMLRGLAARGRPSPAPLRVALHTAGPDALSLHILKRRGPLLERALPLVLPPVLTPRGLARANSPLGRPAVVDYEAVAGSADWLRQLGQAVRPV